MNLRPGRLLGGGVNTIAHTLAAADFRAPLRTSLVPTRGTGAPTFTRATTATVIDHEGVLRTALAGEARFTGARRVQNLLLKTEDLANAAWTKISGGAGSAPVVTAGFTDPVGGSTAFRIQANAGGAASGDYSAVRQVSIGGNLRSIYVKSNTASSQEIYFGAPAVGQKVTATTTWQRLTAPLLSGNQKYDIGSYGEAGNATVNIDVLVWHPQLEDVTAQSIQTAGEYVSVGVLSAPYHGTGVDGVKCFDTDLSGNVISSSTLKGYLAEGARTNLLLRSQDFNSANWNLAGGNFTVTDSGIASPIAGVNFQKLAVTTTTNTNCNQVVAGSGSTSGNTYSVYVKKGSGATECNNFNFYNNTTAQDLYRGTLDYDTGVFTTTGGTGTAVVQTLPNGVYRLQLTNTAGVSNGDNLRVYCGFVGDVVTAGKYFYAIGAQLEAGSAATSYTPTTATAVTRNADVLTYPDTGNISNTAGTSYVEFSAAGVSGLTQQVLARDTNGRFPYINTFTDRTLLYDGTTQSNATVGASFINSIQKSAQSWGVGTKSVSYAGTAVVTSAYDGTQGTGAIAIGCNNSGTEGLGGNIRNVCIWLRKLPDAILKRISK